jgi:hypothetical protein
MKATPFATFCTVTPAAFTDARSGPEAEPLTISVEGDVETQLVQARLNKALYEPLWRYLRTLSAVRYKLPVELSPTLRADGDQWVFLSGTNEHEVFHRIKQTEGLSVICNLVRNAECMTLGDLLTMLVVEPALATTETEATTYLDTLVDLGFLRLRGPATEQTVEWDIPLRQLLESVADPRARTVLTLLKSLRAALQSYSQAPLSSRIAIIDDMRAQIQDTFRTLNIRSQLRDLPLYEDATAEARARVPTDHRMRAAEVPSRSVEISERR